MKWSQEEIDRMVELRADDAPWDDIRLTLSREKLSPGKRTNKTIAQKYGKLRSAGLTERKYAISDTPVFEDVRDPGLRDSENVEDLPRYELELDTLLGIASALNAIASLPSNIRGPVIQAIKST